jgi:hypothetical protein
MTLADGAGISCSTFFARPYHAGMPSRDMSAMNCRTARWRAKMAGMDMPMLMTGACDFYPMTASAGDFARRDP